MSTRKFVTFLAAMALSTTMAVAQPMADGITTTARHAKAGAMHKNRGAEAQGQRGKESGPFVKIALARRLDSLTPEQKTKIDSFLKENRDEAKTLQKELHQAMQDARKSTDRNARREAMKEVRGKFRTSEKKVDKFLKDVLTKEQQTQVQEKISGLRVRAADRVHKARANDDNTSKSKAGKRDKQARHGKKMDGANRVKMDENSKGGKKADRAKMDKKRRQNKVKEQNAANVPANTAMDDATTSGTAGPSPFARN